MSGALCAANSKTWLITMVNYKFCLFVANLKKPVYAMMIRVKCWKSKSQIINFNLLPRFCCSRLLSSVLILFFISLSLYAFLNVDVFFKNSSFWARIYWLLFIFSSSPMRLLLVLRSPPSFRTSELLYWYFTEYKCLYIICTTCIVPTTKLYNKMHNMAIGLTNKNDL